MSYCLPATLMRIPYSFMEAFVWIVFTYFEVGLAANPGRSACCSNDKECMGIESLLRLPLMYSRWQ